MSASPSPTRLSSPSSSQSSSSSRSSTRTAKPRNAHLLKSTLTAPDNISTEWIEEDIYQGIGAPARRKLQVREILAAIMQKYYDIEEAIAEEGWPEEQAQEAIQEWLQLLGSLTGPLRAMALQELKKKLSPESQHHSEVEKDDDVAVEWDETNDVDWDMELIEVGNGVGLDDD